MYVIILIITYQQSQTGQSRLLMTLMYFFAWMCDLWSTCLWAAVADLTCTVFSAHFCLPPPLVPPLKDHWEMLWCEWPLPPDGCQTNENITKKHSGSVIQFARPSSSMRQWYYYRNRFGDISRQHWEDRETSTVQNSHWLDSQVLQSRCLLVSSFCFSSQVSLDKG